MATHNSKFVQKWLTVVQLRFLVKYLVLCGTTLVLQAMPVMHKFSKRWLQALRTLYRIYNGEQKRKRETKTNSSRPSQKG